MNTFKFIVINTIILLLFQYCNEENNKIDYTYLSYVSKIPSVEILVPVNKDGNKIEMFFDNHIFFQRVFKNKDIKYEEYLKKLYTGDDIVFYDKVKDLPHVIVNNTAIWEEYKEKGLTAIMNKYLTKTKNYYYVKNEMSNEELNDLKRILFINSYLIGFDDVYGRYHFQKFK